MASKGLFPLKRFYDSNVSFATLSSDTLEVPVLHTAVLSSQRTAAGSSTTRTHCLKKQTRKGKPFTARINLKHCFEGRSQRTLPPQCFYWYASFYTARYGFSSTARSVSSLVKSAFFQNRGEKKTNKPRVFSKQCRHRCTDSAAEEPQSDGKGRAARRAESRRHG